MILYVSDSGGIVTKEYSGTPEEETQNLAAARIAADEWACVVALLPPASDRGVKSADAVIYRSGAMPTLWEIKTNTLGTKGSIDNALRKANKQSKNVILHLLSNISDDQLWRGIRGRIKRTCLQQIAVIRGNTIKLYTREEILAKNVKKGVQAVSANARIAYVCRLVRAQDIT